MKRPVGQIGRPPMEPHARRDIPVKVLVTSAEKTAMDAAANARGLSVSTWLRMLAIEAMTETNPAGSKQ